LKLTLGFARTEYLDRVSVTNGGDDSIVVGVEVIVKLPIAHVLIRAMLGSTAGKSGMLFHVGGDFADLLTFMADNHNHSLAVVNPQTDFGVHRVLLIPIWMNRLVYPSLPILSQRRCSVKRQEASPGTMLGYLPNGHGPADDEFNVV
jgi:hypothetical protein